jgi:zinc transport system permease protein
MSFIPQVLELPVLASCAAAIACGTVGTLTLVRRNTYVAGAISHSVLAGLGLAQFLSAVYGLEWFTPTLGALVTAVIAALFIAYMQTGKTMVNDAALSAVWTIGMAIGLAFMNATPGYQNDLMSYMFGSIVLVSSADVYIMFLFDAIIIFALIIFWRGILSVCFNSELAKVRSINVNFLEVVISLITALAIVLLVKIVGIVLVIALLTLPSLAARQFAKRFIPMMALSSFIALFTMLAGLAISWHLECQPSPPIVLSGAAIAVAAYASRWLKNYIMLRKPRD